MKRLLATILTSSLLIAAAAATQPAKAGEKELGAKTQYDVTVYASSVNQILLKEYSWDYPEWMINMFDGKIDISPVDKCGAYGKWFEQQYNK